MKSRISKHSLMFLVLILILLNWSQTEIKPDVITEKTRYDTDDPAIWYNSDNPEKSLIFGTDKNLNGAIYAFDLSGNIVEEKTIRDLQRPNNVDIRYNFKLNDSVEKDILAFTERDSRQVRIFSIPDMKPLDGGGFKVFTDEKNLKFRSPMGISFYKSTVDNQFYLIVGRKEGPKNKYLYQYKLRTRDSKVQLELVRKFGEFSGKKEIEAIAVDDELGFIYYADEGFCVRKYYAEPSKGDLELACFGKGDFKEDIEGIAIATFPNGKGVIIISNQQAGTFNIYERGNNKFLKEINLGTKQSDGCEVITLPLNPTFDSGLFVAMNNNRNFYLYNLSKLNLQH